jgi:hypothetical protein
MLIGGEGKTLDKHFVQLESVHHLEGIKVPNNNVSLYVSKIKSFIIFEFRAGNMDEYVTGKEESMVVINLPRSPCGFSVLMLCIFQSLQLQ